MNYFLKVYGTVLLLLISLSVKAQLQVSFPTTRAILQRNNSNQATIRITGYYTSSVTRIEARLQARDGVGTSTDWQVIQNTPAGGVFAGDLTGTGGWYNLDVRGMNGDQQVGTITTVERVGIGEVFIVAGQSNGQGVHQNSPNPRNDLVNCVNYLYPSNGFPNDPPAPVFTLLDNTTDFTIAPRGVGSWCWGQLGDILAKRLKVPILFFNAAFSGTAVRNWRESAPEGGTAYGVYNGDPYPGRQPYINLKISLQFYANMLGLRAVLWHQGEADNLINTSTSSYVNDLKTVINQARQDYNKNMAWVVARVSYGDFIGGIDEAIIAAQNQVISSTPNVFAGPNSDIIQVPRKRAPLNDPEGLHFDYDGLVDIANAWNNSLTDSFFQSAPPISASPSPTISVACASNNTLTLTVNGNYPTVQWESGESGSTITKGAGIYRAKIKDGLGNTFYSSQVRVSDAPVASVVDNRPPSVCIGSSLGLTANYDNVIWLNQQTNTTVATTRTLSTTTAGAYYIRYRDVSGCDFTSNTLNVTVNSLPATPAITNDKPTTFCQGDNTALRASSDNVQYNWSDGQKNKVVTIGSSGSYFLTVTDQNGCTSATSNTVAVTANPVPAKPVISTNGPTTFCADRTITLTAPQEVAYQWTNGQTSQSITLNQSGDFAVRTQNQFGCTSEQSAIITLKVNPLPDVPTISPLGATTFCDGNRVSLIANSPFDVVWSSGQTNKSITIGTSGNYAVQAQDQNGCLSSYSPIIVVKVNPLPTTPVILANPSPIICEGSQATLRVDGPYTVFWSTGDSTQRITTANAGTYSAKVRDVNGCVSAQSGSITVELRPIPPPPTVNIIGTYTLEAVSSTNGTLFRWRRDNDSLAVQSATIKANQSGTYTARSSIIYSQTLTCFSLPSAPVSFTIDVNNKGLSVYPNPNPDKILIVETRENLTNAVLTIYTLTGQVVLTTSVPSFDDRKQLTLTGMPSGSYILRVQAADFDVSKRIILGL
ncbi:T9SS type A sorting domain-containing protein [Spirosoma sp. KCTC 42546]|uniref:T9SS type A sorting domain-containing protein n=1 Tax=Spirosoma sp. KCTC 42546 TaxID=2520506 RepID=UPI00115BC130|nr:sialate O-acetylesterase [Spirosoma sp. KCTC 42546]QDK83305.1 T9SS type A sorting domain-containing protein [Spirosoma sp. KCTC 42546]